MSNLSYPDLIFKATVLKDRVNEDLEAISAFDPTATAKLTTLDTLLAEARQLPEHRLALKEQIRATDQLWVARDQALDEAKKLRYFVNVNFDNDPDFNAAFPFRYLNEARFNEARLLLLFDNFTKMLPTFASRLETAGYGPAQVAGFMAAVDNFHQKSQAKATAKADLKNTTIRRKEVSRKIYDLMVAFCTIGKIIFENIPARYEHYVLFDRQAGSHSQPETGSLELTVRNTQGQPLAGITFQLLETDFADLTDDEGLGSFEEVPAGNYTLRLTSTGFAMHEQPVTLADDQTLDVAVTLNEV
ncbi:MAG: carboxypeptidase-like regulatory domain-containing protein [Bacteroidales bacterium]|nr:carboxypeptidase-like regulatory domain-containing protein [Bacteroidales bacterium]